MFNVMFISHLLYSYNDIEYTGNNPIKAYKEYRKAVNYYRNCHNCHVELNMTIKIKFLKVRMEDN